MEVAVAHRPRYDDWSLPKGKLDPGETVYSAAVREVLEETGYTAVLGRHLGQVAYRVGDSDKTVDYFSARAASGAFAANDEVDELRWLPVADAVELLTYHQDRDVLAAFAIAPEAATVLLVRHAHAGNRSEWEGDDAERPLSERGLRQVERLTGFLRLFSPEYLHAVPNRRCSETIRPLIALPDRPLRPEAPLGEVGYRDNPDGALTRLLEIASQNGPAVVCSQGGTIPGLLAALGVESGVEGVPAKKGSAWLLAFDGDKLVGAHYEPAP
ncbi:NUDIX domain-containing protein [Actinokineospora guangxiensis]|uniref:NUDIX domain-containing protein n=1 Tax=Actinokineospora guangxiensis TaxID=1490288 RepID=A0ABW0EY19_9PSEU